MVVSMALGAGVLLVCFAVLAVAVRVEGHVPGLERSIDHALLLGRGSGQFDVAHTITNTGSTTAVAALAVVVALVVWLRTRDWRCTALCVVAPALAGLCESTLKPIVGRDRPPTRILTGEGGYGFPSGHTTGSTALAVAVIVVAALVVRMRPIRMLVIGGATVYAIAIGLSRLAVGAHRAADVLGGWLLGTAVTLAVAAALFFPGDDARRRERPVSDTQERPTEDRQPA